MTFKQSQIKELIDQPNDHLELLDSQVVLVNGPSFKLHPLALIAKIRHSQSKLTYNQLIKMSPNTANNLMERLDDSYSNLDKLSDT